MKSQSNTFHWSPHIWHYRSCRRRSSSPFIRSWTSKTASTDWLSGVSCVFRIGDAVLTSTSHSVSACAGIGSWVFGSTLSIEIISTCRVLCKMCMHLLLLEHENYKSSPSKDIPSFVDLRTAKVSQSRGKTEGIAYYLARSPRSHSRLGMCTDRLWFQIRV